MSAAEKELAAFISKYTPEIADLARQLFARMREMMPNAIVLVYDNYNALAIGFGPNERASDAILSLAVYPRWISLFFLQGASFPDPAGLLTGSGKKARHRVLPNIEELDRPDLQSLIAVALAQAQFPIASAIQGQIVIKSVSKSQRPRRPVPKSGKNEPGAPKRPGRKGIQGK